MRSPCLHFEAQMRTNKGCQGCIRREEEGGGSGTQKFVNEKWPKSLLISSHYSHCEIGVQAGGWGSREGYRSLLLWLSAVLTPP